MDNKTIICSGALVYARSTKRFLLLHRTQGRAKDVWGLVGGTNEKAETPWEGLRREIFEEIGEDGTNRDCHYLGQALAGSLRRVCCEEETTRHKAEFSAVPNYPEKSFQLQRSCGMELRR